MQISIYFISYRKRKFNLMGYFVSADVSFDFRYIVRILIRRSFLSSEDNSQTDSCIINESFIILSISITIILASGLFISGLNFYRGKTAEKTAEKCDDFIKETGLDFDLAVCGKICAGRVFLNGIIPVNDLDGEGFARGHFSGFEDDLCIAAL